MKSLLTAFVALILVFLQGSSQCSAASREMGRNKTKISGKLFGNPFHPEKVVLDNGLLEIRQGGDFLPERNITVFLHIEKGRIPEGEEIIVNAIGKSEHNLTLVLATIPTIPPSPTRHEMISTGYKMKLKFGKETKKGFLPGSISLLVPGKMDTQISGNFVALVKGFRIIDGQVDLAADSTDTLLAAAELYMRSKNPGKVVKTKEDIDSIVTLAAPYGGPQWGYAHAVYSVDGKDSERKFMFDKKGKKWNVKKELKLTEIYQAHPNTVPRAGDSESLHALLEYAVALKGESDANRKYPGKVLQKASINAGYNDIVGLAKTEFAVEAVGGTRLSKRYLFYLDKGNWKFRREMSATEPMDMNKEWSEWLKQKR
ncbi:MAG: hypothetical protein HYS23_11565 [Geobacter sp.]|nr:hypothetical protein [Geobacter sp.]